ncbi:MAG: methylmalonyl-CoA mutase family protein [Candidatus Aureabacteria bacterium]|nr:methylmalonyl-CoA mutase family protein [Candidatus Auribacterota bacterium]
MEKEIRSAKARWQQNAVKKARAKIGERKPSFATSSEIPIDILYTPEDIQDFDYIRDLGFPGEFPFTRGVQPTMYRSRLWTMRQYAGFGSAEESNERYRYLIAQGQTGLSVAFDLPTQIGYDSDHPMAEGEVGKVGVAVDSLDDMEILFKGISLETISTSMTINSTAAILLAMYIAVAEKEGIGRAALRGTIQNDILKEYVARGTYIFPPRPSLRIVTDIFSFCRREVPQWNTISVSGYHIREAGATAVQELAFTLADGIAYVQAAADIGLDVDEFAPRISFFFNAHNNLFEEVAKFRAARRMWSKIMRDRFKARDPRSLMLRFHTQTGGSTLTAQQADNNIARVTLQALAAVLGGTQSLHTNSRDEALCLPTEESVRIALRTQQIIAEESGVADVVDPLAGSYYLEWLTDRVEREADKYLRAIDEMGGVIKAIENGYIQREIQTSAYEFQKRVERREQIVVGLNQYTLESEPHCELLRVNPLIEEKQRARLKKLREKRNAQENARALDEVERAARGNDNLIPPIISAVRSYTTVGEICDRLRTVFGEYRPMTTM